MIKLREYQKEISIQAHQKLLSKGLVYLSMEVRTGKTLTALETANLLLKGMEKQSKVLFITKKKAIKSIEEDYKKLGCEFKFKVINYESVHKIDMTSFLDLVIIDEAHNLGTYPKPSNRYKNIKSLIDSNTHTKIIYLSGTPSPESYSQLFHQFKLSEEHTPFSDYKNFYHWAKKFVTVTQKNLGYGMVNDYSKANKKDIWAVLKDYFISYTQQEAGFNKVVEEEILYVEMNQSTYDIANKLKKDLVVEGKDEVILADTGAKLQQKMHQIYSGTVKFESGNSKILDYSKAHFIRDKFKNKKIAIFYVFKEEFNMLKETFPNFTNSPEDFNESNDLVFLGQVSSSREGVNLSTADALIMYNIQFSALSYLQGKDRMTSKSREKKNKVYWVFSDGGIEDYIYRNVINKKDYTLSYFKKDFEIKSEFKQNKLF